MKKIILQEMRLNPFKMRLDNGKLYSNQKIL